MLARSCSTHTRLIKPSRPIPLKSVLGSSPWKPMSPHCLVILDSSVTVGISRSHSWEVQQSMVKNFNWHSAEWYTMFIKFNLCFTLNARLHEFNWNFYNLIFMYFSKQSLDNSICSVQHSLYYTILDLTYTATALLRMNAGIPTFSSMASCSGLSEL